MTTAEDALADHGAFERRDGGFAVTTTPLDATATVEQGRYRVVVRAPMLDAVVEGETVAPVVEEGWLETFERRVGGMDGAVSVDPDVAVRVDADAAEAVVEVTFEAGPSGADDAKAAVDYVEGTYVQGIIPGYDYGEPAASLLGRAADRSRGEGAPPL